MMLALEAGATGGEGDSRCTPDGIPSDAASIEVDPTGATAGSYLKLSVAGTGRTSAVVQLRAMFDAWRATNPCPGGMGGSGGATGGAGTTGAAGTGNSAMPEDGAGCSCSVAAATPVTGVALMVCLALASVGKRRRSRSHRTRDL